MRGIAYEVYTGTCSQMPFLKSKKSSVVILPTAENALEDL